MSAPSTRRTASAAAADPAQLTEKQKKGTSCCASVCKVSCVALSILFVSPILFIAGAAAIQKFSDSYYTQEVGRECLINHYGKSANEISRYLSIEQIKKCLEAQTNGQYLSNLIQWNRYPDALSLARETPGALRPRHIDELLQNESLDIDLTAELASLLPPAAGWEDNSERSTAQHKLVKTCLARKLYSKAADIAQAMEGGLSWGARKNAFTDLVNALTGIEQYNEALKQARNGRLYTTDLEEVVEAQTILENVSDPDLRDRAFETFYWYYAQSGKLEKAEEMAMSILNNDLKPVIQCNLAKAWSHKGAFHRAINLIASIPATKARWQSNINGQFVPFDRRQYARSKIVEDLIQADQIELAFGFVMSNPDSIFRTTSLLQLFKKIEGAADFKDSKLQEKLTVLEARLLVQGHLEKLEFPDGLSQLIEAIPHAPVRDELWADVAVAVHQGGWEPDGTLGGSFIPPINRISDPSVKTATLERINAQAPVGIPEISLEHSQYGDRLSRSRVFIESLVDAGQNALSAIHDSDPYFAGTQLLWIFKRTGETEKLQNPIPLARQLIRNLLEKKEFVPRLFPLVDAISDLAERTEAVADIVQAMRKEGFTTEVCHYLVRSAQSWDLVLAQWNELQT